MKLLMYGNLDRGYGRSPTAEEKYQSRFHFYFQTDDIQRIIKVFPIIERILEKIR